MESTGNRGNTREGMHSGRVWCRGRVALLLLNLTLYFSFLSVIDLASVTENRALLYYFPCNSSVNTIFHQNELALLWILFFGCQHCFFSPKYIENWNVVLKWLSIITLLFTFILLLVAIHAHNFFYIFLISARNLEALWRCCLVGAMCFF